MYAYISSPQLVWTKIHLQTTIQIKNHLNSGGFYYFHLK